MSAGRRERRSATRRKISLPVSAHEWTASASIDAEPVTVAATVFAPAMSAFARNATITVTVLSPPPSGRATRGLRDSGCGGAGVGASGMLPVYQPRARPARGGRARPGRACRARAPGPAAHAPRGDVSAPGPPHRRHDPRRRTRVARAVGPGVARVGELDVAGRARLAVPVRVVVLARVLALRRLLVARELVDDEQVGADLARAVPGTTDHVRRDGRREELEHDDEEQRRDGTPRAQPQAQAREHEDQPEDLGLRRGVHARQEVGEPHDADARGEREERAAQEEDGGDDVGDRVPQAGGRVHQRTSPSGAPPWCSPSTAASRSDSSASRRAASSAAISSAVRMRPSSSARPTRTARSSPSPRTRRATARRGSGWCPCAARTRPRSAIAPTSVVVKTSSAIVRSSIEDRARRARRRGWLPRRAARRSPRRSRGRRCRSCLGHLARTGRRTGRRPAARRSTRTRAARAPRSASVSSRIFSTPPAVSTSSTCR